MSNKNLTVGLIAVAIIAVLGLFLPVARQASQKVGAILDTSYFDYFQASTNGGFQVGSNTVINGSRALTNITSATLSSTLTQSTSNTATTTAALGCIQTVATSTATPVRLAFTLPSVATSTFGAASIGLVVWQFGSCPI